MTPSDEDVALTYMRVRAELDAGDYRAAVRLAEKVIGNDPADDRMRELLVSVHYRMGNMPAAIATCQELLQASPQLLVAWRRYARLLVETWQFDRADAVLAQALSRFSVDEQLLALAIFVKQELGLLADAQAFAVRAAALYPESLQFGLDAALLLPMVQAGSSELALCRQTYTTNLSSLRTAGLPRWQQRPAQVLSLERSNFLLAYQGGNDLPLQRDYASILGEMIDLAELGLREPLVSTFDGGRRLRVGFVCQWFYTSTVGTYFERWITHLDRTRFEVYVYYTGHTDDALTARIRDGCDQFVRLNAALHENARQIKQDRLDVLVHLEVGMSTSSHLLSVMRLAPVQCAAWGHPVTTGSDAIDYFFSCRLMEPDGHAGHYSEKVILLDGIGVDFAMPSVGNPLARSDLALPAAGRLYFCPQSLFKIHPDMDELLASIVGTDPGAVLVFFQSGARAVTLAFADRLSAKLRQRGVNARGQIKFLPRMDNETFRRALTLANVVLDTVHWSGGGTSLDAIAGDVPVVTLPGGYMRGRQTAAMLQLMQLTDLIAADADDYVRKAIEVASNAQFNAGVRYAIATQKTALFDQSGLSRRFAEALYAAATSG